MFQKYKEDLININSFLKNNNRLEPAVANKELSTNEKYQDENNIDTNIDTNTENTEYAQEEKIINERKYKPGERLKKKILKTININKRDSINKKLQKIIKKK
jgi:hypothetical protein